MLRQELRPKDWNIPNTVWLSKRSQQNSSDSGLDGNDMDRIFQMLGPCKYWEGRVKRQGEEKSLSL